jgi:hypothetical protein
VRGGTSFLCPTATKKRSKENASQPQTLKCPERAVTTVWDFKRTLSAEHLTAETLPLRTQIPTRFATSVGSRQNGNRRCAPPSTIEGFGRAGSVGLCACPRALVAKRVDVRVRRGRVSGVGGYGGNGSFEVPNRCNCTLGTLKCLRLKGVFFASFLCRRWTKK